MSLIRPDDRPGDVLALIVVIIIALMVLMFLPYPLWVRVG